MTIAVWKREKMNTRNYRRALAAWKKGKYWGKVEVVRHSSMDTFILRSWCEYASQRSLLIGCENNQSFFVNWMKLNLFKMRDLAFTSSLISCSLM